MRRMSLMGVRQLFRAMVVACAMLFASAASALPVGELIQNGGFQTDPNTPSLVSWATTGTVNARAANNPINTTTGNAGFERFFETAFAVLGDADGVIGGDPTNGGSSIRQSFTLGAIFNGIAIGSYDLTIRLDSVFDGDDSQNQTDNFFAKLTSNAFDLALFAQSSDSLPDCGPAINCANNQIMQDPFTVTLFGLSPGVYTLAIQLSENGNSGTNTAAGIDNVSVTGSANPIPEPGIVWLSGLALVLLGLARRRIV